LEDIQKRPAKQYNPETEQKNPDIPFHDNITLGCVTFLHILIISTTHLLM
jgi:hypothetical protein